MKTSILFLGVFTAGVLTDMHVDWQSWFWGLATGFSLCRIAKEVVTRE